jgi:hypothetical protein
MQRSQFLNTFLSIACAITASACNAAAEQPNVAYGTAAPIGRWNAPEPAEIGGMDADAGRVANPGGAGGSEAAGRGTQQAGTGGSAGAGTAGRGGSAGTPAAGSGGSNAASSATSLAFDVTTSPVGGRYQPKNIGAIWVQDSSGKLVKSLEVWAGVRRRYLTRYSTALAGATIDVVASATLPTHRTHHATWDMKNRNGAIAPPGTYTLMMELTDSDMTGRSNKLTFNTDAAAQTLTPSDAPSFSAMMLQVR